MRIDVNSTRQYLVNFEIETLLIEELGWDHHKETLDVEVDEQGYLLTAIAEKRGMVVFICSTPVDGSIPNYATRRKIEQQVAKSVHEHLIIYTDDEKKTQIWQWVKREAGRPSACREHHYYRGQSGDPLIQKLETIAFSLEEEEDLTLVDVARRVRAGFDIDRVTKRFYDRFKKEHDAFLKFLKGIPDEEMQRWYASVMVNRLMFIYFIQKKGFLNNDTDYLRTKLAQSQEHGRDKYYKAFLCPLFFEGFAKKETERTREMNRLLGKVPYLNGGIFQRHQIEEFHGRTIQIADVAFEQLFNFFDQYQWHLDERPLRNDNEINPDVLGYIFEKYINQKQMGAYYTKEDITEYISKNTVIPFLFDAARKGCKIAFEGEASVWKLLQADPDRYIYDAVKKGVEWDLPAEIAVGIDDVSKRTEWNTLAPTEYALPTEIWREVVARRQRYDVVRAKLTNGEIHDINDFITYNLDIRQFAQDVIENCEGPELLRAFWQAINQITILDPTCGSGAFLFAALNILETLYEACLDRMEVFLDELEHSAKESHTEKFSDFRKVLERIDQHPSHRYFILKSIIINNLYGVDIMEEAIEICKLRLFLKMVAQVENVRQIEPLPDIDFNIQAGNTLVGYATYGEVERAVTSKLDFDNTMKRIKEKAEDIDHLFTLFRQQQTELGGVVTPANKQALRNKLKELEDELNRYLAGEYGIEPNKTPAYQKWLSSHKPFHWFIEFYGILKNGGFDVIIGNPPYVEYSKVKKDYTIDGYQTESCGNLYAFMIERSTVLGKKTGRYGLIVPIALISVKETLSMRTFMLEKLNKWWFSNFAIRPAKLFHGVEQRLTIVLCTFDLNSNQLNTTKYHQWYVGERPNLFSLLEYVDATSLSAATAIVKVSTPVQISIVNKVRQIKKSVEISLKRHGKTKLFFHRTPGYWIRMMDFEPYFKSPTHTRSIHHIRELSVIDSTTAKFIGAVISSSLYFFYFFASGNCRNLTLSDVKLFPVGEPSPEIIFESGRLFDALMENYQQHSVIKKRGVTEFQEFNWIVAKPVVDDIDRVLAEHYGFTDEELDFIINYDIKYRMGLGSDSDN